MHYTLYNILWLYKVDAPILHANQNSERACLRDCDSPM